MQDASVLPLTAEIVVTLRLRFKAGALDHVLQRLLPVARLTRQEAGNISFDVFRARDASDELILFERWKGRPALEQHWQEPYMAEVFALFAQYLVRPLDEAKDVTYLEDLLTLNDDSQ